MEAWVRYCFYVGGRQTCMYDTKKTCSVCGYTYEHSRLPTTLFHETPHTDPPPPGHLERPSPRCRSCCARCRVRYARVWNLQHSHPPASRHQAHSKNCRTPYACRWPGRRADSQRCGSGHVMPGWQHGQGLRMTGPSRCPKHTCWLMRE